MRRTQKAHVREIDRYYRAAIERIVDQLGSRDRCAAKARSFRRGNLVMEVWDDGTTALWRKGPDGLDPIYMDEGDAITCHPSEETTEQLTNLVSEI